MKKIWDFIKTPLIIFIIWRLLLFAVALLGSCVLPHFGNMYPYANTVLEPTKLPVWIWSFGGFDGVHYLRIAQNGYKDAYYQAFFPFYPILIKFFNIIPKDLALDTRVYVDKSYFYIALVLSNIFALLSIIIYKFTHKTKNVVISLILLFSFPTAFYFGAIYTESIFIFLMFLFLYFFKKEKYVYAGLITLVASATRVIGILFFIILVIRLLEHLFKKESVSTSLLGGMIIAPLGLLGYMYYLWKYFKNPFIFITSQPGFGAERSSLPIITFPQVFVRYAKMLLTVRNDYQLFTVSSELFFSIIILILIIWAFRKIDFYTWLLSFLIYIIPTLTGTFSSMPRYVIYSFALLIPVFNTHLTKKQRCALIVIMSIIQVVFVMLFTRGYWIA